MKPILPEQLEQYRLNLDLVEATAQQIIKDFSLFDEEITFSGDEKLAYQELFNQIYPVISRLLNLDSERFFAVLYAIDLDERKIKELLFGSEAVEVEKEITQMIIEREFIKVVYRKHWRE